MKQLLSADVFTSLKQHRRNLLRSLCVSAGLLLGTSAMAQVSVTVPNSNLTGAFLGPLANTQRTYQMIIDDTLLTTLNGKYINSISFRLPASVSNNLPVNTTTYSSYEVWLSDGVDPVNRQLNFASNVVGTQTMARSGTLVIPAGAFTTGANPNAFSFQIMMDTPWLYNGTNLVIEIRHTGSDGSSASMQAASVSSTGYGTEYTACWQGTGNVSQGNFTYVQINALDNLGVHSVEIDPELTVYPNPAKDEIFVKSNRAYKSAEVVNYLGQTVLRRDLKENSEQLNVSHLPTGNYLLKLTSREGSITVTKFIKE